MYIYAHRGSSARHPENTVEAFSAAVEEGADGIETDLRLTADGRIVLAHDEKVRGADGVKRKVGELTLAQLKRFAHPGDRSVPTLEELIEVARGAVGINLEVKDPAAVPFLGPYLSSIRDPLITSFHFGAVSEARRLYPGVPAGMVAEKWGEREREEAFTPGFGALSLKGSLYRPEILARCRGAGMKLNVWVVNDPETARRAVREGVDGIYTDRPGQIRLALG